MRQQLFTAQLAVHFRQRYTSSQNAQQDLCQFVANRVFSHLHQHVYISKRRQRLLLLVMRQQRCQPRILRVPAPLAQTDFDAHLAFHSLCYHENIWE